MKNKIVVLALAPFIALASTASAQAQGQAATSVASFFQYPSIGMVKLSPDDSHFALTVRSKEGRNALASCSTSDLKSCTFILKGDDADIVNFFWVNDRRLMVETGDAQARNISSDGNWFAANLDGSETREVMDNRFHTTGRALDASYRPLVTRGLADGSDDILVGHGTFTNTDYSLRNLQPFRLNTRTGALTPVIDIPNPEEAKGWMFDRNDQARIMIGHGSGKTSLYYREPSGPWTSIASYDDFDEKAMSPRFFGFDGALYVSVRNDADTSSLYRYDVKTQKARPKAGGIPLGF